MWLKVLGGDQQSSEPAPGFPTAAVVLLPRINWVSYCWLLIIFFDLSFNTTQTHIQLANKLDKIAKVNLLIHCHIYKRILANPSISDADLVADADAVVANPGDQAMAELDAADPGN